MHGTFLLGSFSLVKTLAKIDPVLLERIFSRLGADTSSIQWNRIDIARIVHVFDFYNALESNIQYEQDDPLVLKEIEEEMESIIEFLQKTKSKDGVRLAPGNDYEKARVAVSKSFTKAMDILKEHLPALHLHLEKSLVPALPGRLSDRCDFHLRFEAGKQFAAQIR